MRPKVGLVLGSGGLRGLAHIGVLKVLEQEQIPIDYIAGCSIGSLIGALYCAGLDPETIAKLAKHLKRRHWLDFIFPKMGIISGERTLETIRLLTRQKTFAELDIPLAVVATDLNQGREVVFSEGSVAQAVRASISVPGIFVPIQLDDMLLVDGAVLNPTPVNVAKHMGADVIIAVDLSHSGVVSSINNVFDVVIQSIDIMQKKLLSSWEYQCDILIRPQVEHISPSSFENVDECIALGEQHTIAVLPEIKQLLINNSPEHKAETDENPIHQT